MLDHQARKDATFEETSLVLAELTRLAPIIDATRFVASAALLYTEDIGWAWNFIVSERLMSLMAYSDISTQGRLMRFYEPLYKSKVGVDILDFEHDLTAYSVVLIPNLYIVKPEIVENLKRYVDQGGLLIMGPKAGLKDWNNVFFSDLAPACGLAELFGVTVKARRGRLGRGTPAAQSVTMAQTAPFAAGVTFANPVLVDDLEPGTASIMASHHTGEAAITVNRYGKGLAVYLGCEPEAAFYHSMIAWLIGQGKLVQALATDADVEVTVRAGGGHRLTFILNHSDSAAEIALEKTYRELISDQPVHGQLVIEAKGVRILDEATP